MEQPSPKVTFGQKSLISFGSNATDDPIDAAEIVQKSSEDLAAQLGFPLVFSRIYRTPAFPPGSGPDFANAVGLVETDWSARDMLDLLHRLEDEAGRVRKRRWGQRILDLDLLAHGDVIAPDIRVYAQWRDLPPARQRVEAPDEMILPHPRLQDRAFVLVPLAEIAPDWTHPVSGLTTQQMLSACDAADIAGVVPLE